MHEFRQQARCSLDTQALKNAYPEVNRFTEVLAASPAICVNTLALLSINNNYRSQPNTHQGAKDFE